MKTCGHCRAEKPVSEFHKSRSQKDGLAGNCKPCCAEWKRQYRLRNLDKLREYDKARAVSPKRAAESRATKKRWRKNHITKAQVHSAFSYAVRLGKVNPQPCWVCGEKAHGHHASYAPDMVLAVTWLCSEHHKAAHAVQP